MVVASLDDLTGPSFQELLHLLIWPELLNAKENWVKESQCLNPSCVLLPYWLPMGNREFTILDVMPR